MPETDTIDRSPLTASGPKALTVLREPDMRWLDTPRDELIPTLLSSLYPGAKRESVEAVLDYCAAAGLNVMLKPVHIVPMSVKKPGTNQYEYRDIVMPGINHYRTQASRTGTCLGKTEPEWGPLVERQWGEFKMMVPEWCKVTVKRLVGSHVAEFTAQEFWDENYATKGKDSTTPNAMWQKRPKGQLHKCTEAQALRMAFPELVGAETAEEMEGKTIDLEALDVTPRAAVRSLDNFAGSAEQGSEPAGTAGGAQIEGDDDGEGGAEEATLSDEAPDMPPDLAQPFYNPPEGKKPDWAPGWKWLNETFPGLTPAARQALTDEHAALLWAVYRSDSKKKGPQSKAALKFAEDFGVIVPEVKQDA
jgi:phage recombination protein Bet